MLFSDQCYTSMKNVCIHTNHHPFLLYKLDVVCFFVFAILDTLSLNSCCLSFQNLSKAFP